MDPITEADWSIGQYPTSFKTSDSLYLGVKKCPVIKAYNHKDKQHEPDKPHMRKHVLFCLLVEAYKRIRRVGCSENSGVNSLLTSTHGRETKSKDNFMF